MISIGTHFFQEIKESALDFGPPRGLFVLILTSVSHLHSSAVPDYFLTVHAV